MSDSVVSKLGLRLDIQVEEMDYKGEKWFFAKSNFGFNIVYGRTPERAAAFLLEEISKNLKTLKPWSLGAVKWSK